MPDPYDPADPNRPPSEPIQPDRPHPERLETERLQTDADLNPIGMQFINELIVFLIGIALGFFWHIYYSEEPGAQTHIIIGLIIIIFCMARYFFLLRRK